MDEKAIEEAMGLGKVFEVGESFVFSAQVPDSSGGCSNSRCSHCGNTTAFIDQICRACRMPFVGPAGFPQWSEWNALSADNKRRMAENVYRQHQHGRLGYFNVDCIPLTPRELSGVESVDSKEARVFEQAHGVSPRHIRGILIRREN